MDQVVAGETGFIEGVVTEDDEITIRDLTGCAVLVSFWREDAAAPHVNRLAKVTDPTNGIFLYRIRGDEYSASDSRVLWQATVAKTEFNATSFGRGGFRFVGPARTVKILPAP